MHLIYTHKDIGNRTQPDRQLGIGSKTNGNFLRHNPDNILKWLKTKKNCIWKMGVCLGGKVLPGNCPDGQLDVRKKSIGYVEGHIKIKF